MEFIGQPVLPGDLLAVDQGLAATADILCITTPARKHASITFYQLPTGGAASTGSPEQAYGQMQRGAAEPITGDWIEWFFSMPSTGPTGVYLFAWVLMGPNIGYYDFSIDGHYLGRLDGYLNQATWDWGYTVLRADDQGPDFTRAGRHAVRVTVGGKNAGSTARFLALSTISIYQPEPT